MKEKKMKKYGVAICCATVLLSSASADVLFSEDFEPPTSGVGDQSITTVGWVNDIANANNMRIYEDSATAHAVWSWHGSSSTEAFYTTTGHSAGFPAIDLAIVTDLTLSVDNHSTFAPESTLGYFAVQMNESDWFVSDTPVDTPTATWTTHQLPFDPSSSEWNDLTVSGTGATNTSAVIGGGASADLTGQITGVGFVIMHTAGSTMDIDNFAVLTSVSESPPAAPSISKLWINHTTAKLHWGSSVGATSYNVKMSASEGGPYTPVASTADTSFWVSNLVVGVTNYFVVAAENEIGESDPSGEVAGVAQSFAVIGDSDSSWGDWVYSYKEAVFDGDVASFYDSPNSIGSYVGVDLGDGNAMVPVDILYYPRSGHLDRMVGAEFQGSNDGEDWDSLATIESTPIEDWNHVYPETAVAYRYIRLFFASEGYGNVAEIAFATNLPPFHAIEVTPSAGAALDGPIPVTLSAEVEEWGAEFVSADLYLNDVLVASNNTPSVDGINLVSYDTGELAIGAYTGQVIVVGSNPSVILTNAWTFDVIPTPSVAVLALWNVNMAGSESSNYEVPDGTAIAAPSFGSDDWNNLISPLDTGGDTNEYSWMPTNALSIADANGANPIGLKWTGSDMDWRYTPDAATPADELFIGYFGSGDFDNTMEISGLDPAARYDIYVYFTWQWNENQTTYEITEGTGEITNLALQPERDNLTTGAYADLVRGENYVVFTQLTPSPAGNIHINATSSDGGWSGIQIAEVSSSGPTLVPEIQYFNISGGIVSLEWTSEIGVSYSILRTDGLVLGEWLPAKSGILGMESTTSNSVPVIEGAELEFYKIEAE